MGKIKTFFNTFIKSCTSPRYYKDILDAPFGFSLKFFLFFCFLFAIVSTVYISAIAMKPAQMYLNKLPAILMKIYPQELVVTIKNGEVSTNVKEPYAISIQRVEQIFKDEKDVLGANENDIQNIIVIDTNAGVEDFPKYKTAMLLTKGHISYINDNKNIESVDLSKVGNMTINRNMVETVMKKIIPFLSFIFPLLIVVVFLFNLFFLPVGLMTYLLFFAGVLWLIGKIIKYPLMYKKSYQMGLHLIVIPTTLFGILGLLHINVNFSFMRTILLSVISIVILNKIKKTPVTEVQNQTSISATSGK
jgi:hypothetical protein